MNESLPRIIRHKIEESLFILNPVTSRYHREADTTFKRENWGIETFPIGHSDDLWGKTEWQYITDED